MESQSVSRSYATPWTVAHQAPLSMEFSRQESWSGLPFPSPGNLSNLGIEPGSPPLQADALPSKLTGRHGVIQAASTLREFLINKLSSFDKKKSSIGQQCIEFQVSPISCLL